MQLNKFKLIFYLIIILIYFSCCIPQVENKDFVMGSMENMQAIKDQIFKDYDRSIRPTTVDSNFTEVYIIFIPKYIVDVDEERGLFVFDSYVWLNWFDIRLQWNYTSYDDHLQVPEDLLWVPDISVLNSHSDYVDASFEVPLQLYPNGYVYWFRKMKTVTSCSSLSQTNYPNDRLTCKIELGSWTTDGWIAKTNVENSIFMGSFKNSHHIWELIESEMMLTNNTWYFDCCNHTYVSFSYHIPLKRRPLPEIAASRLSCIIVMILTLATYWLPSDSSMKYQMNSLLFMSLAILLVYVANCTRNSQAVLFGASFVRTTMYIGILTVLLQVFIITKVASYTGSSQPPVTVIEILNGPVGKYLLIRSPFSESKTILHQMKQNEADTLTFSNSGEWSLLATALDRFSFFIMLIVTISVHHL